MELTVEKLEQLLRKYNKNTLIHVGCNCCNRSGQGVNILKVEDRTNQTYGFIELNLNATSKGQVELNEDMEQFYKRELEKRNLELEKIKKQLKIYEDTLESIESSLNVNSKRLKWESEK